MFILHRTQPDEELTLFKISYETAKAIIVWGRHRLPIESRVSQSMQLEPAKILLHNYHISETV